MEQRDTATNQQIDCSASYPKGMAYKFYDRKAIFRSVTKFLSCVARGLREWCSGTSFLQSLFVKVELLFRL